MRDNAICTVNINTKISKADIYPLILTTDSHFLLCKISRNEVLTKTSC